MNRRRNPKVKMKFEVTGTDIKDGAELIIERQRPKPRDIWSGILRQVGMTNKFRTEDVEVRIGGGRGKGPRKATPATELLLFTVQNPDPDMGAPDEPSIPLEPAISFTIIDEE